MYDNRYLVDCINTCIFKLNARYHVPKHVRLVHFRWQIPSSKCYSPRVSALHIGCLALHTGCLALHIECHTIVQILLFTINIEAYTHF